MLIKISIDEWINNIADQSDVHKAGQEADGSIIYAIVPDSTSTTGEVLEDMPSHIMQELYPGKFGLYLTIAEINNISSMCEFLTKEEVNACRNYSDLLWLYTQQLKIDDMIIAGV